MRCVYLMEKLEAVSNRMSARAITHLHVIIPRDMLTRE